MLAGTGSDVGKSVLAAGLCRIFLQDGYHPAPFKAQNMALNSAATPDGLEIGRAQAVQAEAAGIAPEADMNPLLLKPQTDHTSQVVLLGRPAGTRAAYDYFRREGREELRDVVVEAFRRLERRFNPIVMEGAGSISELNLRESDLVNMPMARAADADVILVGDIDRGGIFASLYGSVMLQDEADRRRIKGIIVNKFRGDMRLFESGRRLIEQTCGVPVLGVVPWFTDIAIEEEDSVALARKRRKAVAGRINVAVVLLRHISNFTDFNALERDERVNLYYTDSPAEVDEADVVLLPGSKSTIADLRDLRLNGMASAIDRARRRGATIAGICGGYQMMGLEVADPEGIEGEPCSAPGLGLLPVRTRIGGSKLTVPAHFSLPGHSGACEGYEIHMGTSELEPGAHHLCMIDDTRADGCIADARCFGTYIHGFFDNAPARDMLLAPLADRLAGEAAPVEAADPAAFRNEQYDRLADLLRRFIDIPRLYQILSTND